MNGQEVVDDSISLENLTWSSEEFTLSDFVDKFPLPQIVKVQEGYYGPDEDSCLGADQILFLHAVKYTEKVQARDRRKRYLHIPLNCSQKVELRPSNLKDVYEGVGEVAKIIHNFPKFVRVTQGYYSMDGDNVSINPGDKLKLLRVVPGDQNDYLVVENQDRSGFPIRVPLSAQAGFQPLSDGREYYLKEATTMTQIPFFFQFIDPPQLNAIGESSIFNSTLGVLRVEKTYQDATVICTTKEGTTRTVVSCPKKLQITVAAANGALIGDSDYVRVCRFFHDGVSLKKIESMEAYNVFASRDTIREYVYDVPKVPPSPTTPDQEYVIPLVPKQRHKEKAKRMNSDADGDDSDDHEYTYISDKQVQGWVKKDTFDYDSFRQSFEGGSRDESNDEPQSWVGVSSNEQKETEENGKVEMEKAEIKNGILYFEKPKPPPVSPKPVIPGKPKEKKEIPDTEHSVSAAPSSASETESMSTIGKEPKTDPLGTPAVSKDSSSASTGSTNTIETGPMTGSMTDPMGTPADSEDLSSLTLDGVSRFLEQHRFPEFIEVFKYNEIDGEMLVSLDLEMMEALGMNPFQRKKLKKLLGGWRPRN